MSACLWCDDPVNGDVLCAPCRAVNDHPPYHCAVPGHTVPTLGPTCAACDLEVERRDRQRAANAPLLAWAMEERARFLAEDWRRPWPGMEFCKGIYGMSLDKMIRDLS